jgi:general nucleoside transport system permease protein
MESPGVASMSGTEPFPVEYWLPTIAGFRLSIWSIVIAVVGVVLIYFLLRDTYFGLRLRAVGRNMKSAYRMGIATWQHMLLAFILCGFLQAWRELFR